MIPHNRPFLPKKSASICCEKRLSASVCQNFLSCLRGGQRQENFRSRATKRVWNVLLCSLPLWSFSRRFRRFRIPYRSGLSAFWLLPGRNRWQLITYLYFSLYWRNFFKYSLKYRHMSFQNVRIDSRSLPTYEADLPLKFFFPQHKNTAGGIVKR